MEMKLSPGKTKAMLTVYRGSLARALMGLGWTQQGQHTILKMVKKYDSGYQACQEVIQCPENDLTNIRISIKNRSVVCLIVSVNTVFSCGQCGYPFISMLHLCFYTLP